MVNRLADASVSTASCTEAHGENAVSLDPGSAITHCNLGIAYYARMELGNAEACQKRALDINPK